MPPTASTWIAAALGMLAVVLSVGELVPFGALMLLAGGVFVLGLPRHARLVVAALCGAAFTLAALGILWTLSWSTI